MNKSCHAEICLDAIPDGLEGVTLFVNCANVLAIALQLISYICQRKIVNWFHTFFEICTILTTAVFIISDSTEWEAAIFALLCVWVALNLFSHHFDLLFRIKKALLVGLYYIIGFELIVYILIREERNLCWLFITL